MIVSMLVDFIFLLKALISLSTDTGNSSYRSVSDSVVPRHKSLMDILGHSLFLQWIQNSSPSNQLKEIRPEPVGLGALQTESGFPPVLGGHLQSCCRMWYSMGNNEESTGKEDLHTGWRRRTEQDEEGPQIPEQMHETILMMMRRERI